MTEAPPMSDREGISYLGSNQNWHSLSVPGWGGRREPYDLFWRVWWLEGEVNNGGFHQYFLNSAGDASEETICALREIGAAKTASLLDQAGKALFGGPVPTNRDDRLDALDAADVAKLDQLEALDRRFLAYEEDLEVLLAVYLRREGVLPLYNDLKKKGWFS